MNKNNKQTVVYEGLSFIQRAWFLIAIGFFAVLLVCTIKDIKYLTGLIAISVAYVLIRFFINYIGSKVLKKIVFDFECITISKSKISTVYTYKEIDAINFKYAIKQATDFESLIGLVLLGLDYKYLNLLVDGQRKESILLSKPQRKKIKKYLAGKTGEKTENVGLS